jgi:HSP20 family protein
MNITKTEPVRDFLALRDAVERLVEDALIWPRGEWGFGRESLALDMYETDGTVRIEVPLPGVKPEAVDISLEGNILTIKGEKEEKEEVKEKEYYRREVRHGTFFRSVTLPPKADPEMPEATFEDGILTLTFPKRPEAQTKKIPISK